MSRVIVFGATGSLGRQVIRLALTGGHRVTAVVRTPSRLPPDLRSALSVHEADLRRVAQEDLAQLVDGHDALINCAGHVSEGHAFVDLVDRLVSATESLPAATQPVSWLLAGAALLDAGPSGCRGVDLPGIESTDWPHRVNFERLTRSELDWRLLCPGPMVEGPPLGQRGLRVTLDRLPVDVPPTSNALVEPQLLPLFAKLIPELVVPYADAAALMLANLDRGGVMARHRVGLALLPGMRDARPSRVASQVGDSPSTRGAGRHARRLAGPPR